MIENIFAGILCLVAVVAGILVWRLENPTKNEKNKSRKERGANK